MIEYQKIVLGDLETNCYIVWDTKSKYCLIIDPADDGVAISEEIESRHLIPVGVAVTHGHFDHIMGALDLKLIYSIPFYCSSKDEFLLNRQSKTAEHFLKRSVKIPNFEKIDKDLDKIKEINLGEERLEIIKTPGHTPGSVCLYWKPTLPSHENGGLLFSGDTLFAGARGRTDFAYGDTNEIYKSLKILMDLDEEIWVFSGHGEETTIGREKDRYKFD